MTVHFRRRRLSRMDELGALSTSVLIGLGSGVVTYYVTRLLLSRERLGGGAPEPAASAGRLSEPADTSSNSRSTRGASGPGA